LTGPSLLHEIMAFKRNLLLVLLLAALLSADDSFANKDGKVVFAGKGGTSSAQLAFKNKALSMTFKATGSRKFLENKVMLNLGGCIVEAGLVSSDGPRMTFKSGRPKSMFNFPINAKLSQAQFAADDSVTPVEKARQPCTPKFEADGDLQVIKVNVTLDAEADFFSIDFEDAKLYTKQDAMSTGAIVLIAGGSATGVVLLAAGSVGVIFWYIRRKGRKGMKDVAVKVSTKDSKKAPPHFALQIEPQVPKTKPAPVKEKSKCKTVSQEQAPKRNATQEKATKSEVSLSISGSESSLKL